jgi:hypothetical protein
MTCPKSGNVHINKAITSDKEKMQTEESNMRKLVYALAAVLGLYISSNCHAQTAEEMARAKAQYQQFLSWYPAIDKSLKGDLQAVLKAKRKADFDALTYTEYKRELQDQYSKNVNPIIQLQKKYPNVRGAGSKESKELETMRNDAENKYKGLVELVNRIEKKLSTLG